MIILYLKKFGLSEDDVQLIEAPFPRMEAILASGSVDAIATAEPYITVGLQHNTLRVLDWNYVAVRPKTFVSTYAATEEFVKQNRQVIAAFAHAIEQASAIANNNPKKSRDSLISSAKITPEVAGKVSLPFFEPRIDADNILETERLLIETKLLDKPVNIKKMLELE